MKWQSHGALQVKLFRATMLYSMRVFADEVVAAVLQGSDLPHFTLSLFGDRISLLGMPDSFRLDLTRRPRRMRRTSALRA